LTGYCLQAEQRCEELTLERVAPSNVLHAGPRVPTVHATSSMSDYVIYDVYNGNL